MKKFLLLAASIISIHLSAQPLYQATVNANAPGGYYFTCALKFGVPLKSSYNMILDSAGNTVYYRTFANYYAFDFRMQPNGLMSYYNTSTTKFMLMDSTFNIIDSIATLNGYTTDVHELTILPNGHYLMLAQDHVYMDLSGYNYFKNGAAGSTNANVTTIVIQELDENKNIVFEWHAKDHFSFDSVDDFWLSDTAKVDWIHSNALEVDTDGNILMSSRHFDEITKINKKDGSIMWRFGGKYNQFTFIGDTTPFYGQHDVRRLPNGHITLFDDGNHFVPHGARACEYAVDETNKTAELVWTYTYDTAMSSNALGNVQRTEQGATLINYGQYITNNICFNVVDSNKAELFKLVFNSGLYSYRSHTYPALPWSLKRPQVSCFTSGDTLYLDAGICPSYRWNNGTGKRTVAVTAPDTFYVTVPYGTGGYITSERIIVTDVQNYCGATAVAEAPAAGSIDIYPNPAQHEINISYATNLHSIPSIKDLSGRIISLQPAGNNAGGHTLTYDISSLDAGFYFVSVDDKAFKFVKE